MPVEEKVAGTEEATEAAKRTPKRPWPQPPIRSQSDANSRKVHRGNPVRRALSNELGRPIAASSSAVRRQDTLPAADEDDEGALTQPDSGGAASPPYLGRSTSSDGRGPVVSRWLISVDLPSTADLAGLKQASVEVVHGYGNGGEVISWEDGKELHRIALGRVNIQDQSPGGKWLQHISFEHACVVWRWSKRCQCVFPYLLHTSTTAPCGTAVRKDDGSWELVSDDTGECGYRLLAKQQLMQQFKLLAQRSEIRGGDREVVLRVTDNSEPGRSFDWQYQRMLRKILAPESVIQTATRGDYRESFGEERIEVALDLGVNAADWHHPAALVVPVTTLRHINREAAVVELLWYLRGDDNIAWLHDNNCHFWDSDADADGFVGLNYGLMVCYPNSSGGYTNQLEERIEQLCKGKLGSRNLVVSMVLPEGTTHQATKAASPACTSEFMLKGTGDGTGLDMVVTQRSSDVIIGLPYDVVVWSLLLHLICREVGIRTEGRLKLKANKLQFVLNSAHVYQRNDADAEELLRRQIIPVGARTDYNGGFTFPPHTVGTEGTGATVAPTVSTGPAAIVIRAGRECVSMFDLEPRDFSYVGHVGKEHGAFHPKGTLELVGCTRAHGV
jgi:thymidylate synthase